jgi:hypothetical protein
MGEVGGNIFGLISVFYIGVAIFSFKYPHGLSELLSRLHYFSENLAEPGIEPGTYESEATNCDHQTTVAV